MKLTLARAANKTLDTISEDLEKIRKENPEKAIQLALQLMEYVMPKLSRTEMKAEINQRIQQINVNVNRTVSESRD
jgi:precorrin-4 methylase